jgi:hypothetical protein
MFELEKDGVAASRGVERAVGERNGAAGGGPGLVPLPDPEGRRGRGCVRIRHTRSLHGDLLGSCGRRRRAMEFRVDVCA